MRWPSPGSLGLATLSHTWERVMRCRCSLAFRRTGGHKGCPTRVRASPLTGLLDYRSHAGPTRTRVFLPERIPLFTPS
jgi:hypothetical protein